MPDKARPIAPDNPHIASILVRVTPTLRDGLDAWLTEINAHTVGPQWSRTDLIRVALEAAVRTRPAVTAPAVPVSAAGAATPPKVKNEASESRRDSAAKVNFEVSGELSSGKHKDRTNDKSPLVQVTSSRGLTQTKRPKSGKAPKDPAAPAGGDRAPNQATLRKRARAHCEAAPTAKASLAEAMGYQSVAALGNWLRGEKSASSEKLAKVARWLEKRT